MTNEFDNPNDVATAIATAAIEAASAAEATATSTARPANDAPPASEVAPVGWQAPLVDVGAAIARRFWLVLLLTLLGAAAGFYLIETTPPYYRASCVSLLLPREKPNLDVAVSTGSVATGLDSARREASGPLMLPPNPDLHTTILLSRPVLLAIYDQFAAQLQAAGHVTEQDRADEVVAHLQSLLEITGTEEGMITIEVTANDAELAAGMANALRIEMERASMAIERQLIVQQSGFLGDAETKVKADLQKAEEALAKFLRVHGVIDMATQANDILRMSRELKQSRLGLEQQLIERLQTYTEDDEGVQSLRKRIAKHRSDIEDLRGSYLDVVTQESYGEVRIEHDRLRDSVRYKRDLLATVTTQRAVFDIRAQQPASSLALLKEAAAPSLPAGPTKRLTIGLPTIGALLLAIAIALLLEQWSSSVRDPYIARRVGEIQRGLFPRWLRKLLFVVLFPLWLPCRLLRLVPARR